MNQRYTCHAGAARLQYRYPWPGSAPHLIAFPAGSHFALIALAVLAAALCGIDVCAADGYWPHTDDWKEARPLLRPALEQ